MFDRSPEFDDLLRQMSELIWMPLDARERFDAMLRDNFGDEAEVCS